MSDISTYLQQIMQARYGEEVRGAIHDAIEECYDDVSTAKTRAEDAVNAAETATTDAQNAASMATSAAAAAEDAVDDLEAIIASKAVRYDSSQTLTDAQKEQARNNIGAASADDVDELKSAVERIEPGLTNAAKSALLACFQNVAWINDQGRSYYDALEEALRGDVELVSVNAVFNQGDDIIYTDDTLDELRQYLTVTANYDNGTSTVVTSYELRGTLTEGTSIIEVIYYGKTTTFNAIVTNFYNIWEWSSDSPTIKTELYSIISPPANTQRKIKLSVPSTDNRHVVVSEKGSTQFYLGSDDTVALGLYPIPVPPSAVGFTITLTDQTQTVVGYLFKHIGNQLCETINLDDAKWHTGEHHSSGFQASDNLFLGVCIGHPAGVAPAKVSIEFE